MPALFTSTSTPPSNSVHLHGDLPRPVIALQVGESTVRASTHLSHTCENAVDRRDAAPMNDHDRSFGGEGPRDRLTDPGARARD
jgi:hypothetical protein